MNTASVWLQALPFMMAVALVAWAVSTIRRNAGLVDIFWSLFFLTGSYVYACVQDSLGMRGILVMTLVSLWSLRLAGYLAMRNWNKPEDHRYRAIRERNNPGFRWKSLYLVFGLQGLLAWIISAPLAAAINGTTPPGIFDVLGASLVVFGIAYETVADAQLARFKSDPVNVGQVMDRGLWRYSRHPNYFGECCLWWGYWLIAVSAGGMWTVFAPVLMTVLLLKISGVALLEKDIGQRRPAYSAYMTSTNAFLPGPRRQT
jgi:steroid 5-alpha reductase family enzyme